MALGGEDKDQTAGSPRRLTADLATAITPEDTEATVLVNGEQFTVLMRPLSREVFVEIREQLMDPEGEGVNEEEASEHNELLLLNKIVVDPILTEEQWKQVRNTWPLDAWGQLSVALVQASGMSVGQEDADKIRFPG